MGGGSIHIVAANPNHVILARCFEVCLKLLAPRRGTQPEFDIVELRQTFGCSTEKLRDLEGMPIHPSCIPPSISIWNTCLVELWFDMQNVIL